MNWIMKRPLLVGLTLILSANLAIWASAYWNRSSIESTLVLSDRELQPASFNRDPSADRRRTDNNAVEFTLQVNNQYNYRVPPETVEKLGFKKRMEAIVNREDAIYNRHSFPEQTALIVLEQDGPAYQADIAEHKQRQKQAEAAAREFKIPEEHESSLEYLPQQIENLELRDSRLYIVDVGLELETLRAAYPDRSRYAIVPGIIDLVFDKAAGESDSPDAHTRYNFSGRVRSLMSPHMQLPLEWHDASLYKRNAKFQASVNFGRRLEPWISHVQVEREPVAEE